MSMYRDDSEFTVEDILELLPIVKNPERKWGFSGEGIRCQNGRCPVVALVEEIMDTKLEHPGDAVGAMKQLMGRKLTYMEYQAVSAIMKGADYYSYDLYRSKVLAALDLEESPVTDTFSNVLW